MRNIIKIIAIALLLKLLYVFFALLVNELIPKYHFSLNETEIVSLFKRNDAYWYQNAAENGYPKIEHAIDLGYSHGIYYKQSVWAFAPFYPLLIRFTENVFHLNFDYSALILSIIFSISSFILFYLLCMRVFKIDEKESMLYTLFFMFFPFHYFYSMYYTEAIFFTFLGISFLSISKKNYILTSLALIPLVLVRANGIFCLIPLFIYFIETEGGFGKFYSDIKTFNWKRIIQISLFLSGPITLAAYCIYQKQMTGFYFAFVKAQSGWYKELMFPFMGLFRRGDASTQFNSIYSIVYMLIGIIAWKKFPLSMNIYIWICILLPLSSGSATSMPRYISIIFPITIYLTSFVVKSKWKYQILFGVLLLQLYSFYPWLIGHAFSY